MKEIITKPANNLVDNFIYLLLPVNSLANSKKMLFGAIVYQRTIKWFLAFVLQQLVLSMLKFMV